MKAIVYLTLLLCVSINAHGNTNKLPTSHISTYLQSEHTKIGQGFKNPNLVSFADFLTVVQAKYNYKCDLEAYRSYPDYEGLASLIEVSTHTTTASSQDINKFLSELIPVVVYQGIQNTFEHNPSLGQLILDNALKYEVDIVCNHSAAKYGGLASAGRKYLVLGRRIVNLGWVTTTTFNFLNTGYWSGNIQLLLERSLEWENYVALGMANKDIYHEFLHHYANISGLKHHNRNLLVSGGADDIVYACSNRAYSPDHQFRGQSLSTQKAMSEILATIPLLRHHYGKNILLSTFENDIGPLEYEVKEKFEPLKGLIHNYTFDQCIVCGLTEVQEVTGNSRNHWEQNKIPVKTLAMNNDPSDVARMQSKCMEESIHLNDVDAYIKAQRLLHDMNVMQQENEKPEKPFYLNGD